MARAANVAPRNVQPHHAAADGRPEGNVDLVFEVRPRFRSFVRRAAAPAEHAGEDVLEASVSGRAGFPAAAGAFDKIREIEPVEIKICARTTLAAGLSAWKPSLDTRRTSAPTARAGIGIGRRRINVVGIKPDLVVNLSLFWIENDIVGLGECLEFLFGTLVAGIDVGMVFARKFAERLAD